MQNIRVANRDDYADILEDNDGVIEVNDATFEDNDDVIESANRLF